MASAIPTEYDSFLKRFWSIDDTLTSITIPDQSEPGRNGNEGLHQTPKSPKLAYSQPCQQDECHEVRLYCWMLLNKLLI